MSSTASDFESFDSSSARPGCVLEARAAQIVTVKASCGLALPFGAEAPVWLTFYIEKGTGRVFGIMPVTSPDAPSQVKLGRLIGAAAGEDDAVYLFEAKAEFPFALLPRDAVADELNQSPAETGKVSRAQTSSDSRSIA
ncbi:MAG TPA: hypothetical protein VF194_04465 [Ferrovibrio sp.]|uniref:hypothetical protein n=1 Tax=Ferrovibrio sp. TaxID=1917215 RepID=UPI002ED033FF